MTPEIYTFSKNNSGKYEKYIFQLVRDRRLSPVCHSHDFYEVMLGIKGSCVQIINGEEWTITQHDVVILRPGDSHAVVSQSNDVQIAALSVEAEEFERFCHAYDPLLAAALRGAKKPISFVCDENEPLRALLEKGAYEGTSEHACKLYLSYVIKLYLDSREQEKNIPPFLKQVLEKAVQPEILADGIPRLVELSGYSRSHLSRLIKEHLGVTLHEYLLERRLSLAYDALILSSEAIEEIGERLGYASVSHFNKIFKQKFGLSPAALRRQNGWRTV